MQAVSKSEIIVTIGPKSLDTSILKALRKAGASSFRINLSHSDPKSLDHYFSKMSDLGIVPCIDTQGAQLRVEGLPDAQSFNLNSKLNIIFGEVSDVSMLQDDLPRIFLNHPEVSHQIEEGDILKIDFGGLVVKFLNSVSDTSWIALVVAGGEVLLNRAVDIQGKSLALSPLTAFDKQAIKFAIENGCNRVYASFISSGSDVSFVRSLLGNNVQLVSKIESAKGLSNALEIIEQSDAVLIDRGDLSREITIASVPMAVRSVVELAVAKSCPVYVATNVLDSMMSSQLPSRAEISDIYTLLNCGVTGLVLAAEVAIGDNPVSSTALLEYLMRLYRNHRFGLHGMGFIEKPDRTLIGDQLLNWL